MSEVIEYKEVMLPTRSVAFVGGELSEQVLEVNGQKAQKYFDWPTDLDPKTGVKTIIESLGQFSETETWRYQVLVDVDGPDSVCFQFMTALEYEAFEEPFPVSDGGHIIRLNCGNEPGTGASVTFGKDNGQYWLQLVTGMEQDHQAAAILDATVVENGKKAVIELFATRD